MFYSTASSLLNREVKVAIEEFPQLTKYMFIVNVDFEVHISLSDSVINFTKKFN